MQRINYNELECDFVQALLSQLAEINQILDSHTLDDIVIELLLITRKKQIIEALGI
jgi:hypothetical protein